MPGLNKLIINSVLVFSISCNLNISYAAEENYLFVRTVDENNHSMEAEIFKWWFSNDPETKITLACKQKACSEWEIKENIDSPVTVYAHSTKVRKDDDSCWDWYEGEVEIQIHQKAILLNLPYKETVCK